MATPTRPERLVSPLERDIRVEYAHVSANALGVVGTLLDEGDIAEAKRAVRRMMDYCREEARRAEREVVEDKTMDAPNRAEDSERPYLPSPDEVDAAPDAVWLVLWGSLRPGLSRQVLAKASRKTLLCRGDAAWEDIRGEGYQINLVRCLTPDGLSRPWPSLEGEPSRSTRAFRSSAEEALGRLIREAGWEAPKPALDLTAAAVRVANCLEAAGVGRLAEVAVYGHQLRELRRAAESLNLALSDVEGKEPDEESTDAPPMGAPPADRQWTVLDDVAASEAIALLRAKGYTAAEVCRAMAALYEAEAVIAAARKSDP